VRAGWLLAIVYLVCAMMPGAAFAFGDGATAAHCLSLAEQGISHAGMPADAAVVAMHHEHMQHQMYGDGVAHTHDASHVQAEPDDAATAPVKTSHKAVDMQCCGLFCMGALPATAAGVAEPFAPTSICKTENSRSVADNAPPEHYRPPFS